MLSRRIIPAFAIIFFCLTSMGLHGAVEGQVFSLNSSPAPGYFDYFRPILPSVASFAGWPGFDYYPQIASYDWPLYSPFLSQVPGSIQPFPWSGSSTNPFFNLSQIPSSLSSPSSPSDALWQAYSAAWPYYLYAPKQAPPFKEQPTEITLIHIGDLHGHLIPRAHLRSDSIGLMRGGLARMFTKITEIRRAHPNNLLINCGDTIQGSAEALYTRGDAMVDVLAPFMIDAFAPGNWDYLYGTERFRELFAPPIPIARWNALAANLYYDGEPYAAFTGTRVLPPYIVKDIQDVKVGILGFTSHFGPGVLPEEGMQGFRLTQGQAEIAKYIPILREVEKVDLVVMISELGLARNIRLAEENPGIDVILSSDLHEETRDPVVTRSGTIVLEEGCDGTLVGELTMRILGNRIADWEFQQHIIDSHVPEDRLMAILVAQVRESFVSGPGFQYHVNPLNETVLKNPIDTVVGYTAIGLHRSNFSHQDMPAVVEGSSHDFLTDAFRIMGQSDVAMMQGFRYGTHVPPGPIKLEDIYHYMPFGPFIARGEVNGLQIKNQIETTTDSTLNPDVTMQGGGWLLAWSGLTYDLDPYAPYGQRAQNIQIARWNTNLWQPLDPAAMYTYSSFYFPQKTGLVNRLPANNIQVLTDGDGTPFDATEVVVEYLKSHVAYPEPHRIRLLRPMPLYRYKNPEIQPLSGVSP